MKIDIARQPFGVTVASLAVLATLFSLRHSISPDPCELAALSDMPLGRLIGSWNINSGSTANRILTVLVVLLNSAILTRIGNRNMLYAAKAYITATLYLVISCGVYFVASSLTVHLAAMFVVLALERFTSSFRRGINAGGCFAGGFFLGMAVLFYGNTIILLPVLPAVMRFLRRTGRENILAVTGMLTPLFICSYINWVIGRGFTEIPLMIWNGLKEGFGFPSITPCADPFRMIPVVIVALLLLLSLGSYIGNAHSMRTRPARLILVIIAILGALVPMILFEGSPAIIAPFLAIPLSLLMPLYFARNSGPIAALLYLGLIIAVAALNCASILGGFPAI